MAISNVSNGFRPGVCTSTTRPTAPFEGQMIYETDTDMLAIYNGSAWRYVAATTPTNGTVLQVVTGSTATSSTNNSSTYQDSNLTATITPKSSSSKILVQVSQVFGKSNGNAENRIQVRLMRGSTELITSGNLLNYTATAIYNITGFSMTHLDSPATTSATTYKTQFMNPNNTAGVVAQYGDGTSTIVLMEIAA
jgi:hypothetical protein